ncbi:MAG TPA: PASTA domain-containing protein [Candidatus Limnocylindrales bacterium]
MRINVLGRLGTLGAVCALAVAGPLATAAQASTQPASAPTRVTVAAIPTVFNLNGTYDVGGPARPVISNVNDVLTVNMSAFGRPNASGTVLAPDLIQVRFPDNGTFGAVLVAPGIIKWSNGTEWRKLTPVPDVIGQTEFDARQILNAAGFGSRVSSPIDRTCIFVNVVRTQSPSAGTLALRGTSVSLVIPREPLDGCPPE